VNLANPHVYREFLRDALPKVADADTMKPDLRTLYTPGEHRNALDPNVTIVIGGRGTGKTVWFESLASPLLRTFAAQTYDLRVLDRVDPILGFGSKKRPDIYPSQAIMIDLVEQGFDPIHIWRTVALHGLGLPALSALQTWQGRVLWTMANPELVDTAFVTSDQLANDGGNIKLFLFDALEYLHNDRTRCDQLIRGLLTFALELRVSTLNLRAKVFLRPDMLSAEVKNFRDASKILANSVSLDWRDTSLYGLLFHYLGNDIHEQGEQFRAKTGPWLMKKGQSLVPNYLQTNSDAQRRIFTEIAGPYMGTDRRRGFTYTWLPNHLADGRQNTSPRSFLSAITKAAEETAIHYSESEFPLHWDGIRAGVQHASQIRVNEIVEDIPWVELAIAPLSGKQVPIEQSDITTQWRSDTFFKQLREKSADKGVAGPRSKNYDDLVEELSDLGIFTRRLTTKKIDLPDVYRIAFKLGRKGGVPRKKSDPA
jgi:hypothetical protein